MLSCLCKNLPLKYSLDTSISFNPSLCNFLACRKLISEGAIEKSPIKKSLAALSVGINGQGKVIADLNYEEDSSCETDMNIVMTHDGEFVEIQGTAEGVPFSKEQLGALVDCAEKALKRVFEEQEKVLS